MHSSQRPTLSDVARVAGVSIATASRALSNPDLVAEGTRNAVKEAAAACGYRVNLVARSLRLQRTNTILVLAPCIDNPFYPALVRSIEETAHDAGFSVILGFTLKKPESRLSYADVLANGRVDGVVLIDGGTDLKSITGPRLTIPAVQALDVVYDDPVPAVRVDDRKVADLAVRHLAGLGHHRIAHISGAPSALPSIHREEGYRAAMASLGLGVDEAMVRCGYYRREPAAVAMEELLALQNPPTAVFCTNDTMACAAMRVCLDRGLAIPRDISFIGAGDTSDGEHADPPLTTIHVPRAAIGAQSAETLIGLIRGQPPAHRDKILPVNLLLRRSTAALHAAAA